MGARRQRKTLLARSVPAVDSIVHQSLSPKYSLLNVVEELDGMHSPPSRPSIFQLRREYCRALLTMSPFVQRRNLAGRCKRGRRRHCSASSHIGSRGVCVTYAGQMDSKSARRLPGTCRRGNFLAQTFWRRRGGSPSREALTRSLWTGRESLPPHPAYRRCKYVFCSLVRHSKAEESGSDRANIWPRRQMIGTPGSQLLLALCSGLPAVGCPAGRRIVSERGAR